MNKHWYMRGIRKVAWLHKQALLPWNNAAQQLPVYPDFRTYADPGFNTLLAPLKRFFYNFMPAGAPDPNTGLIRNQWSLGYDMFKGRTSPFNLLGFKYNPKLMSEYLKLMRFKNYVPLYMSYIKQNPTTDMQLRANARSWMQNNIDSTPLIPFVDTAENRAARSTAIDNNITKLQLHLKSGQFDPAYADEVQQSIDLLLQQKKTNDTTAFQQIGPDGKVTWQSNLKAPELTDAEKQQPTNTRTTTSELHAAAIASGKGVKMTSGDAAKVRGGYTDRLQLIAKIRAAIKSGDTNAPIAMSGGKLSPTRKIMDPGSYLLAKEAYSPLVLDKLEVQILENMKRLGRSSDLVREARKSGMDAKAQQDYANKLRDANAFVRSKRQTKPAQTAPAPAVPPAAAPGSAQSPATVAQPTTAPKQTPKPNYATRGIPKTYDTTTATGGHASYTRNGITYLQFNNAADAQKALGTNSVMAMTRGTGADKKLYWAPVSAKGTKSMGSYASTPGTVNNTRPKSPNIMRPYGMRGNKNGWKSAT